MTNPAHHVDEDRLDNAMRLFGELRDLKTDEPMLATPMERVCARLADFGFCLAWLFAVILVQAIAGLFVLDWGPADTFQDREPSRGEIAFLLAGPAVAIAGWLTHEIWLASRHGQTIGKRMLGLHVIDAASEGRVSPLRMSGRFLCWAAPLLAFFVASFLSGGLLSIVLFLLSLSALIVPGWLFVDGAHRGLHDRLFGTKLLVPRHGQAPNQ